MKRISFVLFSIFFFYSCAENQKEERKSLENISPENSRYPAQLMAIFDAHGGLNPWQKMKALSFEMEKSSGNEVHTTDLQSRQAVVESDAFKLGYDGVGVWLEEKEGSFPGNPKFYYNLMFYFQAMPFIVSDPGAIYTVRKDTVIERKTYGVIHIGFGRNVGETPEDEYIIYFDKETNQMAWLGYTVTFFEKGKSNDWHYIKYDSWSEQQGLLLPEKMVWYSKNDKNDFESTNTVFFKNIDISETALDKVIFKSPERSAYVD